MMSWATSDVAVMVAVTMLLLAAALCGFGLGFSARGALERRREKRINAAIQGGLRDVGGPALYARTKGEPFTTVLRRHEHEARRDRV